ncbi:hypothetical protein [Pseudonocardia spinosispora]|uniref:hypothetical protein n=1 Tax=Pseudonocardia spinosispora TaxID=103441 RepID=UPI00041F478C|nr:hypothetical protein [Pseudonocardia spinosispora]
MFSAKGRAIQHSADPRDASGRVAAHPAPPVVNQLLQQGQVICTDVVGNTAGLLMRVDDGTVTGSVFYATAVDNGPGNKDLAGFLPATESSSCAPGLAPTQPVTSGDITVRQY